MGGSGGPGAGMPSPATSGSSASKGSAVCAVHGKSRTMSNLVDNGDGTFMCKPGCECKGSPDAVGSISSALFENMEPICAVHGKMRVRSVLMDNGDGTLVCKPG